MVKKINLEEFKNINEEFILLDLYADWCGPCKMLAPFISELSEEISNVAFFKANVDEEEELATMFGVQAIPTIILLKNKQEISRKIGFVPKVGLLNWIKENTK